MSGTKKPKSSVNKGAPAVGSFISFAQVTSAASFAAVAPPSSSSSSSSSCNKDDDDATTSGLQPVYTGFDPELQVVSKKLLKKDVMTKTKAFAELIDALARRNPVTDGTDAAEEFLPYFGYAYLRVSLDNDRKVRELLQRALLALVQALMPVPAAAKGSIAANFAALTASLGPYLRALIGPWWMATADPCPEVAAAATKAFETAIPPRQRAPLLVAHAPALLRYLRGHFAHTAASLSEPFAGCSPEEAAERLERVLGASVAAVAALIRACHTDSPSPPTDDTGSGDQSAAGPSAVSFRPVFTARFWRHVAGDPERPSVRRAAYALVAAACAAAPHALCAPDPDPSPADAASAPAVDGRRANKKDADAPLPLAALCAVVTDRFFAEPHAGSVGPMLVAAVAFVRAFPACWRHIAPALVAQRTQELLLRCPEVAVDFLPAVVGALPLAGTDETLSTERAGATSLASVAAEAGLGLLRWLHARTEELTFPAALVQAADSAALEAAALLLLRRRAAATDTTVSAAEADVARAQVQAAAALVARSAGLIVRSAAAAVASTSGVKQPAVRGAGRRGRPSAGCDDDITTASAYAAGLAGHEPFQALCRVLSQTARATATATAPADTGGSDDAWRAWLWRPLAQTFAALLRAQLQAVADPEGSYSVEPEPNPAEDDEEEESEEAGRVTAQRAAGLRQAADGYATLDAAVAVALAAVAAGGSSTATGDASTLAEELCRECTTRLVAPPSWAGALPVPDIDTDTGSDLPASCLTPSAALAHPPRPWRLARAALGALARGRTLARLQPPGPALLRDVHSWVAPAAMLLRSGNDGGGGYVALQAAAERHLALLVADVLASSNAADVGAVAAVLLGPCVACQSLRAVNTVLAATVASSSLWGPRLRAWLAAAADAAIDPDTPPPPPPPTPVGTSAAGTAAAASLSDRARFLVLVAGLGAEKEAAEAGRRMFRLAAGGWRAAGSKARLWVALSLAPAGLSNAVGDSAGDDAVAVVDLLVAAFFARTRDNHAHAHTKATGASAAAAVLGWGDVRRHLLPRLPAAVVASFTQAVAAQLKGGLLQTDPASGTGAAGAFQPRKWARNACGLLALAVSSTGAAPEAALVSTGLADVDTWAATRAAAGVRRAAMCLLQLHALWRGDDAAVAADGADDNDADEGDDGDVEGGAFPLLTQCVSAHPVLAAHMLVALATAQAADGAAAMDGNDADGAMASAQRLLRRCIAAAAPATRHAICTHASSSAATYTAAPGAPASRLSAVMRAVCRVLLDDADLRRHERERTLQEEAKAAAEGSGDVDNDDDAADEGAGHEEESTDETALQRYCQAALDGLRSDAVARTAALQAGLARVTALLHALTLPDDGDDHEDANEGKAGAVDWRGRGALRGWCDDVAKALAVATETVRVKGAGALVMPAKEKAAVVAALCEVVALLHRAGATAGAAPGPPLQLALALLPPAAVSATSTSSEVDASGLLGAALPLLRLHWEAVVAGAAATALPVPSPGGGAAAAAAVAAEARRVAQAAAPPLQAWEGVGLRWALAALASAAAAPPRPRTPSSSSSSSAAAVLARATDAAAALHALLRGRRGRVAARALRAALDAGSDCCVPGAAEGLRVLVASGATSLLPAPASGAPGATAQVAAMGMGWRREGRVLGVRVAAAQVLDAWFNAGGDLQMDLVNALLDDTDDGDEDGGGGGGTRGRRGETETEAEAEGEAREAAQCLAMAEAVLSEEGSAELTARLRCSGHWGLLPQRGVGGRKKSAAEAAGTGGGGASEEPEEEDEAAAAEEEAGPGDGEEDASPVGAGVGVGAEESGPERHRRLARDTAGTVLLWLLCLQRIDVAASGGGSQAAADDQTDDDAAADGNTSGGNSSAGGGVWSVRARCGTHLRRSGLLARAVGLCLKLCPDPAAADAATATARGAAKSPSSSSSSSSSSDVLANALQGLSPAEVAAGPGMGRWLARLAAGALFRTVLTLPAALRAVWGEDLSRLAKQRLSDFIERRVKAALVAREIALVDRAARASPPRWDPDEFSVRGSAAAGGEVVAVFTRDEARIELRVRLPPAYPLVNAEVDCAGKSGVKDARWRRWVLQIVQLLASHDGSVVDAVLLWKRNVEREFEGAEPCPICYSVLHPRTLQLPLLACPTCSNRFHSACLYEWFRSSGKSKCVICQQPIFH